MLKFAVIKNL